MNHETVALSPLAGTLSAAMAPRRHRNLVRGRRKAQILRSGFRAGRALAEAGSASMPAFTSDIRGAW